MKADALMRGACCAAVCLACLIPARAMAVDTIPRMATISGAHSQGGSLWMSSAIGDVLSGPCYGGATRVWHGFYTPGMSWRTAVETPAIAGGPAARAGLYLGRVSPNPARVATVIEFGSDRPGELALDIYDVGGRCVRVLHRGPHAAGVSRMAWDLASNSGQDVPAGVYFVRLSGASSARTGRVVVLR